MKYGIFELMLAAVVISFVGFAIENTWLLLTKGYMDNRNMTLPFLLGYGVLMVDFYLMFGTPSDVHVPIVSDRFTDNEIYFVLAFFTVSMERSCSVPPRRKPPASFIGITAGYRCI